MAKQSGDERHGFVVAESSFGTQIKPTATDGFRLTSLDMNPSKDRPEVEEGLETRSLQERIEGRESVTWSCSLVNRPSGAAGTAPDYGLLLKHGFGVETVSASTSVTYSPLKDMTGLSLDIYDKVSDDILEGVLGAVVGSTTFNFNGDGFATIDFSGEAKAMFQAGTDVTDGAGSAVTALVVVDSYNYSVGGIVKIASDDNTSAGYLITAINYTTHTLTIEAAATWSDGDVVAPFTPAATVAGSGLHGTVGSLSFDGGSTSIEHIGGSVTLASGVALFNRGFGTASASDVTLPQGRRATGTLTFVLEDTGNGMNRLVRAMQKVTEDLNVVIGTSAGSICTLDLSRIETDPTPIGGGGGLIEYSLPIVGLTSTSTAKEDEMSVVYT